MKKKILTLLFCAMLMAATACSSAENSSAENLSAENSSAPSQTAENKTEADTDTSATEEQSTAAGEETSDAKAESTPAASPEAEAVLSPSPTPSFEVERWEAEKTMYAQSAVNIRKGPSTEHELCGYLNSGEAVVVRGTGDTGWYLVALGEEEGFVSHRYLADAAPTPAPVLQPEASTAAQPAEVQAQASVPTTAPTPAPTAAPPKVVAGTIFVGDSRFVQMHEAVGETGVTWICENSKGYKWFEENAVPRIDNLVGKGTKILINLGVNDPEHYNSYINLVNGKAAEWTQKGAIVYYASVNPVWDNPYTTKEEVITFNSKVSAGLVGVHWIDSYTFLNENGYRIVDGLHYSPETSAVLYNYYITCIQ